MRTKTPLLWLVLAVTLGGSAQTMANNITCYHVMEASCRSETTDNHIGFAALTWAVTGGAVLGDVENCANSYDVMIDFYDYLNQSTDMVPELCRTGTVDFESVHEYRRFRSKEKALRAYRHLARQCMDDPRFERCATTEDLDLKQHVGNTRVLLKGQLHERKREYPPR